MQCWYNEAHWNVNPLEIIRLKRLAEEEPDHMDLRPWLFRWAPLWPGTWTNVQCHTVLAPYMKLRAWEIFVKANCNIFCCCIVGKSDHHILLLYAVAICASCLNCFHGSVCGIWIEWQNTEMH